jgi:hypothetical protein
MCGAQPQPQQQPGAQSPPSMNEELSLELQPTAASYKTTPSPTVKDEEDHILNVSDVEHEHGNGDDITPLNIIKYIISLAILVFSIVITISLIFNKSTNLSSDVSPWLALCVLFGAIIWLGIMEGQQASLVGLTGVVDHLVYKDTHPIAFKHIQLAYWGNNLDRYVNGRQFLVVLMVFVINLCGAPLPGSEDSFGLPDIIQEIFLGSGLAMILMTAMISQLPPQVNASHCMIDFINNYFALFTLYTALVVEFLGVCHVCYLVQNIISLISGKPIKTNEEPRTLFQSIFFWVRVLLSLAIVCFSMAVTMVALFQGKTTMWTGVPDVVSLILFFILTAIVGMLEAMQIAFLATSKMRKEHRGTSFFGKKTVEAISKGQNLPAFFIGRQLMVVSCFFILARVTTLDVPVGEGENIFGVPDGVQAFLNSGLHAALLMTVLGSSTWKLAASAYPVAFVNTPFTYVLLYLGLFLDWIGICSGAWILARIEKRIMNLQLDETYVGTPENPVLSKDALDSIMAESIMASADALDVIDGPPQASEAEYAEEEHTTADIEKGTSVAKSAN